MTALIAASLFHHTLGYLGHLIIRHGYGVLFAFVAAESFSFPVPGEIALLAGAVQASRGRLDLAAVVLVGVVAASAGDNAAYLVGRHAGRPFIFRLAKLMHVRRSRLERLEQSYHRNLWRTVITGRWISPVRGWTALSAGAARVPWPRFFAANLLGGVTWATAVTLAGFTLARHLSVDRLEGVFDLGLRLVLIVVVVAALAAVVVWAVRRRRRHRSRP